MSARTLVLGAVAATALSSLVPGGAHAATRGSAGMDERGSLTSVDVCGRAACADLGASGTAKGLPFSAADVDIRVHSASGARPGPGQCVRATFGFGLVQQADSFRAEGQGKLCAAVDGTATVTGKYSGGGVVGDPTWQWGSGVGTMTAVFAVDGSVSFSAAGTYALSPLR